MLLWRRVVDVDATMGSPLCSWTEGCGGCFGCQKEWYSSSRMTGRGGGEDDDYCLSVKLCGRERYGCLLARQIANFG